MANIVFVDSEKYKGYANSAISLGNELQNKEIIDFSNSDENTIIREVENILMNSKGKVKFISAGIMGINIFNKLLNNPLLKGYENRIQFILNSDKFYDEKLSMKQITLIMPTIAIKEFKKHNPNTNINAYEADFVGAPSKEEMEKRADTFKKDNEEIVKEIEKIKPIFTAFIGGRVQKNDGTWKENTETIFEDTAKNIMEMLSGNNGMIVFHGLRSFTNSKNVNDFKAVEKFYETVKNLLSKDQKIIFLTKEEGHDIDNKVRTPLLKIMSKSNEENAKMQVNSPAGDYYWALKYIISNRGIMLATGEQMNFSPEAIGMGSNIELMNYFNWELTIPSNIQTQEKIIDSLRKGRIPMNANQAFKRMLAYENTFIQGNNQR